MSFRLGKVSLEWLSWGGTPLGSVVIPKTRQLWHRQGEVDSSKSISMAMIKKIRNCLLVLTTAAAPAEVIHYQGLAFSLPDECRGKPLCTHTKTGKSTTRLNNHIRFGLSTRTAILAWSYTTAMKLYQFFLQMPLCSLCHLSF